MAMSGEGRRDVLRDLTSIGPLVRLRCCCEDPASLVTDCVRLLACTRDAEVEEQLRRLCRFFGDTSGPSYADRLDGVIRDCRERGQGGRR
jgi:hypothetical protein